MFALSQNLNRGESYSALLDHDGLSAMFFEEQRAAMDRPQATCGDARWMIQDEHRSNLLHWLEARFRVGFTVEKVRSQLALSSF